MQNRLLLLAAILGVACAGSVASYNGARAILSNGYFDFSYEYDVECAYTTTYGAGPLESDADFQYEEFGFNIYSWANATLQFEFMSQYHFTVMLSFIPFDVTPFTQRFTWLRPDRISNSKPWDFRVSGSRDVHGFWGITTWSEKFKTMEKSFVDYFLDMSNYQPYPTSLNDLQYDEWYQMDYEDAYFNFKPMETWAPLSEPWLVWYGEHEYYGYWFLD